MDLQGYVDVAARLRMMHDRYPDLRLVETPPTVVTVGERLFIAVTVTAYRTPDDPVPAVATAWEPFPGRTPYTRDSEMMNCATSALGRVANLLMPIGKTLASTEEVLNRRMDGGPDPDRRPDPVEYVDVPPPPDDGPPPRAELGARARTGRPTPATDKQWNAIHALCKKAGQDVPDGPLTAAEASNLIQYLQDALPL